jgi:hypothetical protein
MVALLTVLNADELRFDGKITQQGIFLGIAENGKVSFQVYGQDDPQEFSSAKITEIILDKPVKVRCHQRRNRKTGTPGLFKGMQNGQYKMLFSGEKSERRLSRLELHKLEVDLDMKYYMTRMEANRRQKAETLADKKVAAADFLSSGHLSILHFTSPELSVNSRQGNLAKRLCEGSRRPAEYVEILIDSLEGKVARANSLTSLPQFWFYDSGGKLLLKLTGRFTDEDIESAFRQAGKKR